jgi:hypothetical protein
MGAKHKLLWLAQKDLINGLGDPTYLFTGYHIFFRHATIFLCPITFFLCSAKKIFFALLSVPLSAISHNFLFGYVIIISSSLAKQSLVEQI